MHITRTLIIEAPRTKVGDLKNGDVFSVDGLGHTVYMIVAENDVAFEKKFEKDYIAVVKLDSPASMGVLAKDLNVAKVYKNHELILRD